MKRFFRTAIGCIFVLALAVVSSQLMGILRPSPTADLAAIKLRYRDQLCWRGACAGAIITDIRSNLAKYPDIIVEISSDQDQTCWRILDSIAFDEVCASIVSYAVRINWITLTAHDSLHLGDLVDAFGPPVAVVQVCDTGQTLTFANGARAEVIDNPPPPSTLSGLNPVNAPALTPYSSVYSLMLVREPLRTEQIAWRGFMTKSYWPFLCD